MLEQLSKVIGHSSMFRVSPTSDYFVTKIRYFVATKTRPCRWTVAKYSVASN